MDCSCQLRILQDADRLEHEDKTQTKDIASEAGKFAVLVCIRREPQYKPEPSGDDDTSSSKPSTEMCWVNSCRKSS
jgi:hypothetical protein